MKRPSGSFSPKIFYLIYTFRQLNEVVLKVERRVRLGDADKLISQLNAEGIVVLEGSMWRSASERPGAGLESPSVTSTTVTPPPQCLASSGEWIWGVGTLKMSRTLSVLC